MRSDTTRETSTRSQLCGMG